MYLASECSQFPPCLDAPVSRSAIYGTIFESPWRAVANRLFGLSRAGTFSILPKLKACATDFLTCLSKAAMLPYEAIPAYTVTLQLSPPSDSESCPMQPASTQILARYVTMGS